MSPDDISSAARQLADLARAHGDRDGYQNMRDLVALLPVLDALAAGQEDEGRVERWAGAMLSDAYDIDDLSLLPNEAGRMRDIARAAMALADAENAALRTAAERAWYLLDLRADLNDTAGQAAADDLRTSLDAAVRRLVGYHEPT